MNIVLLVIDSLRADAAAGGPGAPRTPFFRRLDQTTTCFRWAYASECWTLPAHVSMFTGLLPSAHGAHFQSMAYTGTAPTAAEVLGALGYRTEVVSRNFMFDGTIPGLTRGFQTNTQPMSELGALNPFALLLVLNKPRSKRLMRRTGFFHPLHRDNRAFLARYSRAMMPADELALAHILERMADGRRQGRPYFIFSNLYDVHWPYPPTTSSVLRPFGSLEGLVENLRFPFVLPKVGTHAYLRPNFRLSQSSRALLLRRYRRAVELMDAKLERFYLEARGAGLLDDTMLVITSDHGEAFGEHDLYLHDGSVYNTHLHVPLWIHHPAVAAQVSDDVVGTRDLFRLLCAVGQGGDLRGTLLDEAHRDAHPVALAEHFHYPHLADMLPRYRQNIAAAIAGSQKVIVRREGMARYDVSRDPGETQASDGGFEDFTAACRHAGLPATAIAGAVEHLRSWSAAAMPVLSLAEGPPHGVG